MGNLQIVVFLILASTALWVSSVLRRDASLVDRWWGLAFVIVAWLGVATFRPDRVLWPAWLLVACVTLWGLRLSWHLTRRNWGRGEDPRYAAMRARRGARFARWSLPMIHWLQAILAWIIAWPVMAALSPAARITPFTTPLVFLGGAAWLTGILFESIGDWQLARHRADPARRGTVLDTGLWRYTRHPNYFGDAMVWWGHWLMACSLGAWWTIFAPALMTLLLVRVSGVTVLEAQLRSSKPGYAEYIQRTSSFVPRAPRRTAI